MKWNKCFVVQYGNIQYTNIVVVKVEKKSNFCLLKVAIVGGRLRLRPPSKIFFFGGGRVGGTRPPVLPIIAAHATQKGSSINTLFQRRL